MKQWLVAAVAAASIAAQPVNPCAEFDALYAAIRDQRIDRASALARARELLPRIREYYAAHAGTRSPAAWRFPLDGLILSDHRAVGVSFHAESASENSKKSPRVLRVKTWAVFDPEEKSSI